MSVWPIQSIEERPDVTLVRWSAFEVPLLGAAQPWTRHFVGYSLEDRQGQVSSPVEAFDNVAGTGRTRSGRVYHLHERPGSDSDARYVWARWKSFNGITTERDVTAKVAKELAAQRDAAPATNPIRSNT